MLSYHVFSSNFSPYVWGNSRESLPNYIVYKYTLTPLVVYSVFVVFLNIFHWHILNFSLTRILSTHSAKFANLFCCCWNSSCNFRVSRLSCPLSVSITSLAHERLPTSMIVCGHKPAGSGCLPRLPHSPSLLLPLSFSHSPSLFISLYNRKQINCDKKCHWNLFLNVRNFKKVAQVW